jgi:hypothetical protein
LASRGPAGEPVHAVAYIHHQNPLAGTVYTISLGSTWWWTVADAKAWIERAVALHRETVSA